MSAPNYNTADLDEMAGSLGRACQAILEVRRHNDDRGDAIILDVIEAMQEAERFIREQRQAPEATAEPQDDAADGHLVLHPTELADARSNIRFIEIAIRNILASVHEDNRAEVLRNLANISSMVDSLTAFIGEDTNG